MQTLSIWLNHQIHNWLKNITLWMRVSHLNIQEQTSNPKTSLFSWVKESATRRSKLGRLKRNDTKNILNNSTRWKASKHRIQFHATAAIWQGEGRKVGTRQRNLIQPIETGFEWAVCLDSSKKPSQLIYTWYAWNIPSACLLGKYVTIK
jgi:hypothetical protein